MNTYGDIPVIPAPSRDSKENQRITVILSYLENSSPAWVAWEPLLTVKKKKKKRWERSLKLRVKCQAARVLLPSFNNGSHLEEELSTPTSIQPSENVSVFLTHELYFITNHACHYDITRPAVISLFKGSKPLRSVDNPSFYSISQQMAKAQRESIP